MDVFEAMERRHSVRSYDESREVPEELVEEVLRCACLAPSAGNVQPWRFLVVRSRRLKERLAEAALGQNFLVQAPVVIAVCADLRAHASSYGSRGVELYALQDTAAAVQNMLLAATALGLGTCWVGAFREEQVSQALEISRDWRPVALVALGYPAREGSQPRKMSHSRLTIYVG